MIKNLFKYLSLIIIGITLLVSCNEKKTKTRSNDENPLYQDASASIEDRIDDLISRMTLEDKAAQMSQYVGLEHMKQALGDLTEEDLKNKIIEKLSE